MRKENKNNNFIQHFFLFRVSLQCAFTEISRQIFWCTTSISLSLSSVLVLTLGKKMCKSSSVNFQTCLLHLLLVNKANDMEDKKLLNKVIILVFFVHKKYSRSIIQLQLNLWCHSDYFYVYLTTFLGLDRGWTCPVYGGAESCQKCFHLFSKDERKVLMVL